MMLTPPDIISQTLLALPMWLLFEVGVFLGERFAPKKEQDSSGHEEYEPPMTDEDMEQELDRIEDEEKQNPGG
jgi:sec-independent protein translocase protein TatC